MQAPTGKEAEENAFVVYVTVGSKNEALTIAREVVQERLAGCANIIEGVTSVYEWKGELQEDGEWILILKTVSSRLSYLIDRVVQLHSYECPCVTSWPIAEGHEPFLRWLDDQTKAR
jgi:periplasmic divalent cation tolerance protein